MNRSLHHLSGFLPLFTDLSTDVLTPPVLYAVKQGEIDHYTELEYPMAKGPLQSLIYKDLVPLQANLTKETLFEIVVDLSENEKGWRCLETDSSMFRVQCVAVTPLCKFRDDITIEVRSDEKSRGAELHMRSRSRVGITDLGTNAKRIQKFFTKVEQIIKSLNNLKPDS
jgi:uncharacterized protein (DUF1499 family)